jgi:two-component system phosphate regulon sensor histidine kinase PhoR
MQRLAGMQQLVRDLRILGELETADLRAHSTEISLSFLLSSVMEDHADIGEEKGVKLTAEPSDLAAIVFGVPRLLQESIANYIDNAIKYTPRGGSVTARVRSAVEPGWFRVEVSDSGVGISAEDKSRLFAEFARVGRGHPALKNVHGTGLGLSIVRRIVESHGGRVGVESEPGHGSTFWLELPPCTGREDVPAENA